ncbi:MAG: DUF5666 domain-containing protein [Pseudomonadales bacterium]
MKTPVKIPNFLRLTAICLTLTVVTACGGGGGSGNSAPAPVAATPAPAPVSSVPTVVRQGPITGFGSVFISGTRFETNGNTDFRKDDHSISESDLRVGMIVKVKSRSRNSAGEWVAEKVEFDEDVKGPIDAISGNALTVLGQTVNVSAETRFDNGLTLGDLAVADLLEVSGHRIADDAIDARFIERKSALDEYEVLGQVRDLNTANETFRVGGLTVRYGSIPAVLDDLEGGLANGLLVEVEDANRAYVAGDLALDATKVEGERRFQFDDEDDNDADEDGDDFEVEGVISEVLSDSQFRLGDLLVTHSPERTQYLYGSPADLAVGTKVEVEGDFGQNGLTADKVKFKKNSARAAGLVNSVDVAGENVIVMGVSVDLGDVVDFEDDRDDQSPFTIADLAANDFLEVRGVQSGDVIRAVRVERDDSDDDSELRGTVQAFDATARTVTLFGRVIITNSSTRYEDSDDDDERDSNLSADQFFQRLHADQTVIKAKWNGAVSDTNLPVEELSLED